MRSVFAAQLCLIALLAVAVYRLGAIDARAEVNAAALADNRRAIAQLGDQVRRSAEASKAARQAVEAHLDQVPLVASLAADVESLREEVYAMGGRPR